MFLTLLAPQSTPTPASTKAWIRVSSVWKEATPFVRVAGTWKQATPFIRVSGVWKTQLDKTPAAIDWSTVTFNSTDEECIVVGRQFTGIDQQISVQIQPGTGTNPTLHYQKTSTSLNGNTVTAFPTSPWVDVTANTTITIDAGEWLNFACSDSFQATSSRTATIVNVSDGNATLDTFNYRSEL
jgi:hypothetical protein